MDDKALRSMVEPIIEARGLELDRLEVVPAGKHKVLRITVDGDGPHGRGPLLDDIAEATREISTALDQSTAAGNAPYTLEVSSRGVGAPLTAPKHYRRNVTRLVKLTVVTGETVTGRIQAATDDVVTLDVDQTIREFAYEQVSKALVQVELNRPQGLDPDNELDGDDEEAR